MDLSLDIKKHAEDIAETERAYAETKQTYEEESKALQHTLFVEKGLFNEPQLISRLPNELLLRIFILYHEMSQYDGTGIRTYHLVLFS